MEYRIESSEEMELLVISGELTIRFASELRDVLLQAMNGGEQIIIRLENISEVDLSCLQLFCSAHRTALEFFKKLTLEVQNSEIFRERARQSGFLRNRGCSLDQGKTCLWIGGDIHEQ